MPTLARAKMLAMILNFILTVDDVFVTNLQGLDSERCAEGYMDRV